MSDQPHALLQPLGIAPRPQRGALPEGHEQEPVLTQGYDQALSLRHRATPRHKVKPNEVR